MFWTDEIVKINKSKYNIKVTINSIFIQIVPLCYSYTVVFEHINVMDVLWMNSMINHCIRKMILSGYVVASYETLYKKSNLIIIKKKNTLQLIQFFFKFKKVDKYLLLLYSSVK